MSTSPIRRFRRVVASVVLVVATAVGVVGVGGTAHASYNNTSLDASCAHRAVTAFAPNLQASPWSVVWAPTLYRYTSAGWQRYLNGATQTQSAASWDIGQVTFSNLPNGYYQVRDTFIWLYNGVPSGGYHIDIPVNHFLDGRAVNLSYNEYRYTTSSYCYAGS